MPKKSKKTSKKKTKKSKAKAKTVEKATEKQKEPKTEKPTKKALKEFPTLKFKTEKDIARDFADRVYEKFDKIVKAIVLFGSFAKDRPKAGSDIDIIIVLDDATVNFDDKLIMWYREELGKIINANPYQRDLHVNTIKLTTWWTDLTKGDPTVINIIRYGEVMIDYAGFFQPLKIMLEQGKIKPTPESMYTVLNRVPGHIIRSRISEMSAIEGCYWAMVETAQALLMAKNIIPPSPEHIAELLRLHFVEANLIKINVIEDYKSLYELHKKVIYGQINNLDGAIIDQYQEKVEAFFKKALQLIDDMI